MSSAPINSTTPHVVIIGGGFGGLTAARALGGNDVRVTLIDKHNHHLFQPLLYQVATANMMAEEIAIPIRRVLRRQENAQVLLGEVSRVDAPHKAVELSDGSRIDYDFLVIAAGAKTNYFGHDEWADSAFGLKNVTDAYGIRKKVLCAFEAAEREPDAEKRRKLLTFVVIGGGPTGVELAGALRELSGAIVKRDFRRVKSDDIRVVLLEAAPRLLLAFHEQLGENARQELAKLGVEVLLGTQVKNIDEHGVTLAQGRLEAALVVWAAGVTPQPLAKHVVGLEATERGFIPVNDDLSIANHPEIFAIGDIAMFVPKEEREVKDRRPRPLPGVAPVAMQQGRHVARMIRNTLKNKPRKDFRYVDKGSMATIGRSRAVLEAGRLRMTGLIAWLAWIVVHVFYLIGFRNRAFVMFEWALSYFSSHRGARLIAEAAEGHVEERPETHDEKHIAPKPGYSTNQPQPAVAGSDV